MIFIIGLLLCWLGVGVGITFKKYDIVGRIMFHTGFFFMLYSIGRFLWTHLP